MTSSTNQPGVGRSMVSRSCPRLLAILSFFVIIRAFARDRVQVGLLETKCKFAPDQAVDIAKCNRDRVFVILLFGGGPRSDRCELHTDAEQADGFSSQNGTDRLTELIIGCVDGAPQSLEAVLM